MPRTFVLVRSVNFISGKFYLHLTRSTNLFVRFGFTRHLPKTKILATPTLITPTRFYSTKAEKSKEKLSSKDRLGSVDKLPKNPVLDEKAFDRYRDEFFAEYKRNRFNPILTESGRIKWESDCPVLADDIYEVILYTKKHRRSLHINTGTHGDKKGNTVVQNPAYAESIFSKEDLSSAWDEDNVSVHIMSKHSGTLKKEQYPSIDIVDAWCYSEASKHVIQNAASDPLAVRLQNVLQKLCKLPQETVSVQSYSSSSSVHGDSSYSNITGGVQALGSIFNNSPIHFVTNSTVQASKKPIHFFELGGIVIGLRLAIALKNKEGINEYYSQLQKQLKPIKMPCPSIEEIEKNEKVLLSPLNDMLHENEGVLADFYQIGAKVSLMLNYDPHHPEYEKCRLELLEIADRYGLMEEFTGWLDNVSSNAQKNLDKMTLIVRKFVAKQESKSVGVKTSGDSLSSSAPLSSSYGRSSSSSSSVSALRQIAYIRDLLDEIYPSKDERYLKTRKEYLFQLTEYQKMAQSRILSAEECGNINSLLDKLQAERAKRASASSPRKG